MNIMQNLKSGFKKEDLVQDAMAIGAGVLYRVVPSLLGLNGTVAGIVGISIPYLLGIATKQRGLRLGALGAGAAHFATLLEPQFQDLTGQKFFTITDGTTVTVPSLPTPVVTPVAGLSEIIYNASDIRNSAKSPYELSDRGMGAVVDVQGNLIAGQPIVGIDSESLW